MNGFRHWNWAIAAIAAMVSGCGDHPQEGGTSFETGNSISGRVVNGAGTALGGMPVHVRPAWHLGESAHSPDDSLVGTRDLVTDSEGHFQANSLPPGQYRIEVLGRDCGRLESIEFPTRSGARMMGDLATAPLASISGSIPRSILGSTLRLRVYGTDHHALVEADGRFRLAGLPPGRMRLVVTPSGSDSSLAEIAVEMPGGQSLDGIMPEAAAEAPSNWRYAREVRISTGSDGFESSDEATDVPLLLRLEGGMFPAQALEDGRDLRVVDSAGMFLPFETMRWNPSARQAQIWVRLDSLSPRHQTHSVKVLWGRSGSRARSSPSEVWNPSGGWSAVWHLASTFVDGQGRVRSADATGQGADALVSGDHRSETASEGIPAHPFDGRTDMVQMAGTTTELGTQPFTLEMWVRPTLAGVNLLHKGSTQSEPGMKQVYLGAIDPASRTPSWYPTYNVRPDSARVQFAVLSRPIDSSHWSHLALRMTPSTTNTAEVLVDWFLDGERIESAMVLCKTADRPSDSLGIGSVLDGSIHPGFAGWMGEVRISRLARSDAWIRLAKEAQTPGTRLVRYLPLP